jgi:flagellar motor switch protein FliN/FliY
MSDFLSQEDIDNLLSQQGDGAQSQGSPQDTGDGDNGEQTEALHAFLDQLITACKDVLPTVTNKDVELDYADMTPVNAEAIKEALGEEALALTLPFDGGISGTIYWLLGQKPTAVLSDLMVMGDGNAEYAEEHNDAIGEMIGQVIGSLTTSLNDMIDESISSSPIQVAAADFDNPPCDIEDCAAAKITMTIGDLGEYTTVLLVPNDLAVTIAERIPQGEQDGGDEEMGEDTGLGDTSQSDLADSGDREDISSTHLAETKTDTAQGKNIEMLLDIDLDVYIKLGETRLSIKRILELGPGSIVELDKMAGEPVDLEVNNKVVAKGEVVVVDENFGIRIVSLVSPEERIKSLK